MRSEDGALNLYLLVVNKESGYSMCWWVEEERVNTMLQENQLSRSEGLDNTF